MLPLRQPHACPLLRVTCPLWQTHLGPSGRRWCVHRVSHYHGWCPKASSLGLFGAACPGSTCHNVFCTMPFPQHPVSSCSSPNRKIFRCPNWLYWSCADGLGCPFSLSSLVSTSSSWQGGTWAHLCAPQLRTHTVQHEVSTSEWLSSGGKLRTDV